MRVIPVFIVTLLMTASTIIVQSTATEDDGIDTAEHDSETSRKIIGSSVVTSVSVILNGQEPPKFSDAVGQPVPRPLVPPQVSSPINLLNPDRYEFYTFNDKGDLIKRLMTMKEIQSIVAGGPDDGTMTSHHIPTVNEQHRSDADIHKIVNNVQKLLSKEMETKKNISDIKNILDTPDVSSSWSLILPAIFGNTGQDIQQQKPQQVVMTPDAVVLDDTTKRPVTQRPYVTNISNQIQTNELKNVDRKPVTQPPSSIFVTRRKPTITHQQASTKKSTTTHRYDTTSALDLTTEPSRFVTRKRPTPQPEIFDSNQKIQFTTSFSVDTTTDRDIVQTTKIPTTPVPSTTEVRITPTPIPTIKTSIGIRTTLKPLTTPEPNSFAQPSSNSQPLTTPALLTTIANAESFDNIKPNLTIIFIKNKKPIEHHTESIKIQTSTEPITTPVTLFDIETDSSETVKVVESTEPITDHDVISESNANKDEIPVQVMSFAFIPIGVDKELLNNKEISVNKPLNNEKVTSPVSSPIKEIVSDNEHNNEGDVNTTTNSDKDVILEQVSSSATMKIDAEQNYSTTLQEEFSADATTSSLIEKEIATDSDAFSLFDTTFSLNQIIESLKDHPSTENVAQLLTNFPNNSEITTIAQTTEYTDTTDRMEITDRTEYGSHNQNMSTNLTDQGENISSTEKSITDATDANFNQSDNQNDPILYHTTDLNDDESVTDRSSSTDSDNINLQTEHKINDSNVYKTELMFVDEEEPLVYDIPTTTEAHLEDFTDPIALMLQKLENDFIYKESHPIIDQIENIIEENSNEITDSLASPSNLREDHISKVATLSNISMSDYIQQAATLASLLSRDDEMEIPTTASDSISEMVSDYKSDNKSDNKSEITTESDKFHNMEIMDMLKDDGEVSVETSVVKKTSSVSIGSASVDSKKQLNSTKNEDKPSIETTMIPIKLIENNMEMSTEVSIQSDVHEVINSVKMKMPIVSKITTPQGNPSTVKSTTKIPMNISDDDHLTENIVFGALETIGLIDEDVMAKLNLTHYKFDEENDPDDTTELLDYFDQESVEKTTEIHIDLQEKSTEIPSDFDLVQDSAMSSIENQEPTENSDEIVNFTDNKLNENMVELSTASIQTTLKPEIITENALRQESVTSSAITNNNHLYQAQTDGIKHEESSTNPSQNNKNLDYTKPTTDSSISFTEESTDYTQNTEQTSVKESSSDSATDATEMIVNGISTEHIVNHDHNQETTTDHAQIESVTDASNKDITDESHPIVSTTEKERESTKTFEKDFAEIPTTSMDPMESKLSDDISIATSKPILDNGINTSDAPINKNDRNEISKTDIKDSNQFVTETNENIFVKLGEATTIISEPNNATKPYEKPNKFIHNTTKKQTVLKINDRSNIQMLDSNKKINQHRPYGTDQKIFHVNTLAKPSVKMPAFNSMKINKVNGHNRRTPVRLDPAPKQTLGLEESTMNANEDILEFVKLCNELAFTFWKTLTSEGISSARSLIVSPFALTSMLAMIFLGARGGTSGEMNEMLRLDDMVTFNPHVIFRNVTDSVQNLKDNGLATSVFVRELFSDRAKGKLLPFYKDKAQQFYSGHVEEVNFNMINDIIRRRTNLLVKRHTWGKISEYLKTNNIWLNPPLAGITANIYQTDCSKATVNERDGEMFFQVLPAIRQRRLVPIPAVVWKSGFIAGYDPELDATTVAFGGIHNMVSTIFVMPGQQGHTMPGDNLERLESAFISTAIEKNSWKRLLTTLVERPGLEVQIPRFSHRSFINATNGLTKMGLNDLFNFDKADLRGLTGSTVKDLYISDMIQINTFSTCGEDKINSQHHIEIYPAPPLQQRNVKYEDQIYAETMDTNSDYVDESPLYDPLFDQKYLDLPLPLRPRQARLPEAPRLRFDKPFLYFVRHNPTGMILYMGRFNPRLLP